MDTLIQVSAMWTSVCAEVDIMPTIKWEKFPYNQLTVGNTDIFESAVKRAQRIPVTYYQIVGNKVPDESYYNREYEVVAFEADAAPSQYTGIRVGPVLKSEQFARNCATVLNSMSDPIAVLALVEIMVQFQDNF